MKEQINSRVFLLNIYRHETEIRVLLCELRRVLYETVYVHSLDESRPRREQLIRSTEATLWKSTCNFSAQQKGIAKIINRMNLVSIPFSRIS